MAMMKFEVSTNNPNVMKIIEIPIQRMAKFEKVSLEQYKAAMLEKLGHIFEGKEDLIEEIYNDIKLPCRATKHSAGYDFFLPFAIKPTPGSGIVIPTGIRCQIEEGWVMKIYPRSGQGFKYGMALYNSTGIIDGDYYYSDNEGHIMMKMTSREECDIIDKGIGFCQAIFSPYGLTVDDDVETVRNGGLGSTTK